MKPKEIKVILYIIFSLICAVGVFYLSDLFQQMAYWDEDYTWYWTGVTFTYLTVLLGVMFFILSFKKRETNKKTFFSFMLISLRIISITALVVGFLWTTLVMGVGSYDI